MLAMVKLAKEYGKGPVQISEISKSELIPQRFLESILLELKKSGFASSKLGKTGGYYLLKKPEKIYLVDIIRYFEGSIAMLACVSEKSYQPCEFCKNEDTCKIKKVFKQIREETIKILGKTTIADLAEESDHPNSTTTRKKK